MDPLDPEEKLAWLRLARSRGIGPGHTTRLVERFGDARAAVAALPGLLATGRWGAVELAPPDVARRELEAAAGLGGAVLVRPEAGYPAALREIPDPPAAILVLGRPALLAGPCVAVVGARNASVHGRLLARTLARDLAAGGVAVVSGLARGIDTAAHQGALEAEGGRTVAVVAGGADVAYPEENANLQGRIAEAGLVVSERPLGTVPRAQDFPRRNRIIAGLSAGVVVVEAAPQSGSLITARLAAEGGRDVMAVPGSPLDPRCRGSNQLLRDGATLVEGAADVRAQLGWPARDIPAAARPAAASRPAGAAPARPAARPPSPAPRPPDAPRGGAGGGGDGLGARLRSSLGPVPVAVDALVRECEASVAAVQASLLDLELEGRLERHPGNRVSLRPG